MSNYLINSPFLHILQNNDEYEKEPKKKSKSQFKYIKVPDIITQAKPSYLNNFVFPINPHECSLTPSNHSNKLNNYEEYLLPPKSQEFSNKKTLILDLDETLVHSSFTPFQNNDIILEVDFDGVLYNIYVLVRPYAEDFLKNISKYFEIIIFTASISKYASPLLDILDKEKNIKFRLFRDHCTFINGIFIKDLKRLNRDLKDVIIVDNSPLAYAFDTGNGLPIKTWYEDPDDIELMKIEPLLIFLSKTKDVRKYIDRFVEDNEILYNEAMSIIDYHEKNKNKINKIDDVKSDNNNSDIEKQNENIKLKDYKINTLNLMNNKKFNLFSFNNLTRLDNCNTTNNNSSNKIILNNSDNEKINIRPVENKKEDNSTIKNDLEIRNDSENNINKNSLNNKRPNIGIFLRKQSSKKKNIFRLSQKPNEPILNIRINEISKNFATNSFSNGNTNNLMPLVLPFSNTVKNALEPKKFINSSNKINILPIHMTKNDFGENNIKQKYTNLLEKFEKGKINKNELKNNLFYKKDENIKISSSIQNNYQGLMSIRLGKKNSKDNKYDLLKIPKSNSINNVLKFNHLGNKNNINKHLESKTPNRHLLNFLGKESNYILNFNQRIRKKNMLYNLIKGIGIPKTGRIKNSAYSAKPYNIGNYSKSNQRKKS